MYIDGSHQARHVFIDAAMSWNPLKIGGIVAFDDYDWGDPSQPFGRPRRAIDAFESVFGDRLELLLSNGRKFYRRLAA